jgi:uncharacterized Ntn-hydrolase superfamily protein
MSRRTHTFSIVARDPHTGDLGVAVQSHWFSVGSIVSWAEPGVGAIATQSMVEVSFGPRGLDLLKQGRSAEEAARALINADPGRDGRQLAIVDAKGNVAVYTGARCIADSGHVVGDGFSCQANMMLNDQVWPAMAAAYQGSDGRPLPERLLAALEAGQAAGGDIRGQQSAAILVVRGVSTGKPWEDRLVDLRVEDHPAAIQEIGRVLRVFRAYEHMNLGDRAIELSDAKLALQEYSAASALDPQNLEMKFWHAVALANLGRTFDSLPMFKVVFATDPNWRTLTGRIHAAGYLNVEDSVLSMIMAL